MQNKQASNQDPFARYNIMGISGFALAFIDLAFPLSVVTGFSIWVLGLILSIIGVFRKPRGFAIAGIILSIITIIVAIMRSFF
ncbi:hypothetical protein IV38_GL001679 [Lactobacillus selangorensis]|uniref:DUF4190 domain-containing protein n=1 Tax=Lactobacillus selangorensis TaxID=81857 RepID=A0A0R2FQW5_9LACO|nr:hypothetical protein [Lactobacillus selangorensis]KRN28225.1 hypothetical protein IV38_GL001679 [Lactobacillus selangorensis]KRN30899.1 hypothetical protein IV40_GL001536 [Lactobacillus selangorensis]